VGVGQVDVDVPKEVLVHEVAVALVMIGREADILIEVESGDAAEIQVLLLVHAHEFPVKALRRAAGGEAEHGIGFFAHFFGDDLGAKQATVFGGRLDDDFHGSSGRRSP
jgi:hypothetical protein